MFFLNVCLNSFFIYVAHNIEYILKYIELESIIRFLLIIIESPILCGDFLATRF